MSIVGLCPVARTATTRTIETTSKDVDGVTLECEGVRAGGQCVALIMASRVKI